MRPLHYGILIVMIIAARDADSVNTSIRLDAFESALEFAHHAINEHIFPGADVSNTVAEKILKDILQNYSSIKKELHQLDKKLVDSRLGALLSFQAFRGFRLLHKASSILCHVYPTKDHCDKQPPSDVFLREMESYMAIFTRDLLTPLYRLPRPVTQDANNFAMRPIFVLGMMRSGTTLLEAMLDMHSQVRHITRDTFFKIYFLIDILF